MHVNLPWGEMSIRGARRPWGELSVGRKVMTSTGSLTDMRHAQPSLYDMSNRWLTKKKVEFTKNPVIAIDSRLYSSSQKQPCYKP